MPVSNTKLVNHALFWIGIFVFYLFSMANHDLFREQLETTTLKLPLLMVAAYSLNYWQVPAYLNRKRYAKFALSLILVLVMLTIIYRAFGYLYLDRYCDTNHPFLSLSDFPYYLLSFHFPALIMYFYLSNHSRLAENQRLAELQKEKAITELKYLKAQLNPHFLFNTLNNLYSFVINKSPKAADMVLQLSEILDYVLYQSQNDKVLLIEELKSIDNYIALQEIRYGNNLQVSFTKELENKRGMICPLLLLSVVENAFKHGAKPSVESPKIEIELHQTDAQIVIRVRNTKPDIVQEKCTESGIGLSNIQRQLNLTYPDKHRLSITNADTYFSLELSLNSL